jgi:(E)-4-hydroxy-3-methylbut-2-enyl-diphosphate synthase
VTEAGEGEDGRVRSAAGIGALLAEGIGDTIRISLSEDPEHEIPVAKKLAGFYPRGSAALLQASTIRHNSPSVRPEILRSINGPVVIMNMTNYSDIDTEAYLDAGFKSNQDSGQINKTDASADFIITKELPRLFPDDVSLILPFKKWFDYSKNERLFPLFSPETYHDSPLSSAKLNLLLTGSHFDIQYLTKPDPLTTLVIFTFNPDKEKYAADKFLKTLEENNLNHNIILNPVFHEDNIEDLRIKAASLLGRYVIGKRAAGICLHNVGKIGLREVTALAFSILQCTGRRITRTLYLSCPTCGRTKFNLQESVKKVKEATGHLKGLKIAVMGCIVNGPGEMAGADYGYVGATNGKVHIYRGTIAVLKNIPEKNAAAELLKLIESDRSGHYPID